MYVGGPKSTTFLFKNFENFDLIIKKSAKNPFINL